MVGESVYLRRKKQYKVEHANKVLGVSRIVQCQSRL